MERKKHIFRSIADFVVADSLDDLKPKKVKCGDIIFVKTDFIEKFLLEYHQRIRNPYVLLTHESDYGVGYQWQIEILNDSKIIKWYAQNTLSSHPILVPIPSGIEVPAGNVFSTLYDLAKTPIPYDNKRLLLTSWKEYLENIKNSQFVLSPLGAGINPFWIWETLYLGSVPIVQESYLQPLYDGMPVMVVKDWSEVTEESMKKFQIEKLGNFSKDGLPRRKKIWLRYWINEIIGTKKNYINNFCF